MSCVVILDLVATVLVCLVVYWPTLSYGYVIDDIEWLRTIDHGAFHPDQTLLNRIKHRLYGCSSLEGVFGLPRSPKLDHATTLTLHTLSACLICHIYGLLPALLFSVHPTNHQTAIWLTGRRYSLINVLLLTTIVTHTIYLFLLASIPILAFAISQYASRRHLPYPKPSLVGLLRCVVFSGYKLTGLHHPMFFYPYANVSSMIPFSQPAAERHLSIPLIFTCVFIGCFPLLGWPLVALYAIKTRRLQVMYVSLQAFYDYHVKWGITAVKRDLLVRLYPEIRK